MRNKKRLARKGIYMSYWVLIEALIITIVIVFLFQYIQGVKDNTMFDRQFLARDLALMLNSADAVQGDLVFTYNNSRANMSMFEYSFSHNTISVVRPSENLKVQYYFYYDRAAVPDLPYLHNPKKIVISKIGPAVYVSAKAGGPGNNPVPVQKCPSINTKDSLHLVRLDYSDSGTAWNIAESIMAKAAAGNERFLVTPTRQKQHASIDDRLRMISTDTDAVVSIEIGSDDDKGKNPLLIYYSGDNINTDKSSRLACLLLEEFRGTIPEITSSVSVPSSDRILTRNRGGAAVKIVIGNDKIASNPLFSSPDRIAGAIINALRKYNG